MGISRLDKIIENNVTISAQSSENLQKIYILQDISETLAMIYDRLCGEEQISQTNKIDSQKAFIIPFDNFKDYKTMHFDHVDLPQGYEVMFLRYETLTSQSKLTLDYEIKRFAIVDAFGQEMQLKESEYGKKWRCWNIKPTEEERKKITWEK